MIQILSVKDEQRRSVMCKKAGIDDHNDLHIIAIHNSDGIICQGAIFKYREEIGEILWLDMGDDIDLSDGLARAVLNIMDIRGVKTVTLPFGYDALAKKLRFKMTGDHFEVSLEGYFCCGCKHT